MTKISCIMLCLALTLSLHAQTFQVNSPSKRIQLTFRLANGSPTYSVAFNQKDFILQSPLGLRFLDANLAGGLEIIISMPRAARITRGRPRECTPWI